MIDCQKIKLMESTTETWKLIAWLNDNKEAKIEIAVSRVIRSGLIFKNTSLKFFPISIMKKMLAPDMPTTNIPKTEKKA